MKSRISSSERYLLGKDLGRFAPVWGGYLLCLVLGTLLLMENNMAHSFARNLAELPAFMGIVNCGYALLAAQVLFGDLFNARMCNALHALPIRREKWLRIHVAAGLLFSLIPSVLIAALWLPVVITTSSMADGWLLCLYVLGAMNLQYLFFFCLAVLCACCTGSRVGMVSVYAIANFMAYLIYFLVDTVYVPMFHGVVTSPDFFLLLCPVAKIVNSVLFDVTRHEESLGFSPEGEEQFRVHFTYEPAEGWYYLFALALVGLVFLVLARWMYRRRRLETAGDFLATRKLELPFMVLFSLSAGAVFQAAQSILTGVQGIAAFLFVGVAVGWFAGRMLIERQTKVFRSGRNWLGMVIMLAAVGLSLYINYLDPLGVEDFVPQAHQVRSAELNLSYRGHVTMDTPEELEDLLAIHRGALADKVTGDEVSEERGSAYELREETTEYGEVYTSRVQVRDYRRAVQADITYQLNNGWTMHRRYWLWLDTPEGALVEKHVSTLEGVFGFEYKVKTEQDLLEYVRQPRYIYVEGQYLPQELTTVEQVEALLKAVIADCQAGTLAQDTDFHPEPIFQTGTRKTNYLSVVISYASQTMYFDIYADSENCMQWVKDTGMLEKIEEYSQTTYG